jgi:hypothetical protein
LLYGKAINGQYATANDASPLKNVIGGITYLTKKYRLAAGLGGIGKLVLANWY